MDAKRFWTPATLVLCFPTLAAAQIEQSVRGAVDHFGPGFTALSEERVDFRLLRPANVVLLWVTPEGRIDLFYPVRSRDRTQRRAGDHAISVSEIPSPIEAPVISGAPISGRASQFTPTGSNLMTGTPQTGDSLKVSGYWVLLTSEDRSRRSTCSDGWRRYRERGAPRRSSTGLWRCWSPLERCGRSTRRRWHYADRLDRATYILAPCRARKSLSPTMIASRSRPSPPSCVARDSR